MYGMIRRGRLRALLAVTLIAVAVPARAASVTLRNSTWRPNVTIEVRVGPHQKCDDDAARPTQTVAFGRSVTVNGRVVCVDAVLPPMGDTNGTPAKLLDVNMLVMIPGKERTLRQWQDLYHAAGLEIKSVTPLQDAAIVRASLLRHGTISECGGGMSRGVGESSSREESSQYDFPTSRLPD